MRRPRHLASLSGGLLAVTLLAALPLTAAHAATPRNAPPAASLALTTPVHAPLHLMTQLGAPVHTALRTSASCVNGVCPPANDRLSDQGGHVITAPVIYLVTFSNSATTRSPAGTFTERLFSHTAPNGQSGALAALSSPYSNWWTEYLRGASAHAPAFGGTINLYAPKIADATTVSDDQIYKALAAATRAKTLPALNSQAIFITWYRSTQTVTAGSMDSNTGFCAYHSSLSYSSTRGTTDLNYVVMPYQDGSTGCTYAGPTAHAYDSMTSVLSHELAETVTDPSTPAAWINTASGDEIGDICGGSSTNSAPILNGTYTYEFQYLWSNTANACIVTQLKTSLALLSRSATKLRISLGATGAPMTAATVTMTRGTSTPITATTNVDGKATFSLVGIPSKTAITVSYATSPAALGSVLTTSVP